MERLTPRAVAGLLFGRCRSAGARGGGNHGGNATEGNREPWRHCNAAQARDDDDDDFDDDDDSEYSGSVATYMLRWIIPVL